MLVYQRVHDLNECILIKKTILLMYLNLNKYLKSSYINSTCALWVHLKVGYPQIQLIIMIRREMVVL